MEFRQKHNNTKHSKKVILHVVQHLAPGGLETLVLEMLRFAQPNHSVFVVSLEGSKEHALQGWQKLLPYQGQLHFLNKKPGFSGKTISTLTSMLKGLKPDVVHTHHIGPLLYGGIAARLAHVPVVIHTEHDAWHLNNKKSARLQSLLLKMIRPQVVADANFVAHQIQTKLKYRKVCTIHNGIDCQKFKSGDQTATRHLFELPTDKIVVGVAGRLEAVKGHKVLIEAFSHLASNTHLAIAGDGSQRAQLEAQVRTLKLEDRVTFLGLVDDMPSFYQSLDLFCLPSLQEGFPLSTLEAQACDIPCVATDVGGVKETLCPNNSTLVEANHVFSLAEALSQQLESSHRSPRTFILKHFDIRDMVSRYSRLAKEASYE
ncbi:glycosyltransferase [Vibrio alginolyticus]|uniref:glycosyltransferase n=1 Tax=Vibrio alginolyticus TaxID=663 RepID=UPI00280969C1|nr:glycosyltransferase [Vibrio alginolyticus]ELA8261388.1 glycosyltransferase [Vibrio alginolyticus]ELB2929083.1 glycosyltransferase [Vibrio alginolyticus]